MFPRQLDGRFHAVRQDDELRWPAVIRGAKTYDVDLGHSGVKIARCQAIVRTGTVQM
jgi:hypothetical protein